MPWLLLTRNPTTASSTWRLKRARPRTVRGEPAVEGEADFDRVAASQASEVYLLLLRVRAVDVYAVAVVDEESHDGVLHVAVETRAPAHGQGRASSRRRS